MNKPMQIKDLAETSVRRLFSLNRSRDLSAEDVADARKYVRDYWQKLVRTNAKDNDSLVGLPNPYLVPSYAEGHEFDYDELFYWDSYFMAQGLLDIEHKE